MICKFRSAYFESSAWTSGHDSVRVQAPASSRSLAGAVVARVAGGAAAGGVRRSLIRGAHKAAALRNRDCAESHSVAFSAAQ